jgi:hypothetical protein
MSAFANDVIATTAANATPEINDKRIVSSLDFLCVPDDSPVLGKFYWLRKCLSAVNKAKTYKTIENTYLFLESAYNYAE